MCPILYMNCYTIPLHNLHTKGLGIILRFMVLIILRTLITTACQHISGKIGNSNAPCAGNRTWNRTAIRTQNRMRIQPLRILNYLFSFLDWHCRASFAFGNQF
jgi:hypothetical protein